MNPIQNTEINQDESNIDSSLNLDVPEVNRWEIPYRKPENNGINPQIRKLDLTLLEICLLIFLEKVLNH